MGDELFLYSGAKFQREFVISHIKLLFRTSQCQDGGKVLKCYEWRRQSIKRRFSKPKHTKEPIKKEHA